MKQILQEQLANFSLPANPELEAKTNLLKSDPALFQLYNDLVVGRLISAEEFWANRFAEGRVPAGGGGAKGQDQQTVGLPSAFLVRSVLLYQHNGRPIIHLTGSVLLRYSVM